MSNATEQLFSDTEVIDLCNSIINIHRALSTLSLFFGDLESLNSSSGSEKGFIIWGLRRIADRFLEHQDKQASRIMEIYRSEAGKLVQRAVIREQKSEKD